MKNWLTTIFGALAAIATFVAHAFPQYAVIAGAAAALFLALLGLVSKQFNVTGGTVPQSAEAAQRVSSAQDGK